MSANAVFVLEMPNFGGKQIVAVQSDICPAVGFKPCDSIAALPFQHLRQTAHRPCACLMVFPVHEVVQSMGHGS